MAKDKKLRVRRNKPLLAAALFCDKVLERNDGVISAINVLDTYTALITPDALAHPDQRIPVSLKVLLVFKSGDATSERTLKLVLRIPTGKRKTIFEKNLPFKGGEQGVNIKVDFRLEIKTQGVYWMDVVVDDARLTRMPLKVVFQEMGQLAQASQNEQPRR